MTVAHLPPPELRRAGVRRVRHHAPAGARLPGQVVNRFFADELLRLCREEPSDAPTETADAGDARE